MKTQRFNREHFVRSLTFLLPAALAAVAFAGCAGVPEDLDGATDQSVVRASKVSNAEHHDSSAPLRLITVPARNLTNVEHEVKRIPRHINTSAAAGDAAGKAQSVVSLLAPTILATFDGVGQGLVGPNGTFSVNSAPPDTNGDIGPNHYIQTVNSDFAIFSKTGTVLYGPVPLNTLWSGFGGDCQTNNDGDPVVLYDPIADRWMISQFSVTGANGTTKPFLQCVAVSQTPDPTGAWYRYSFSYTGFNDYPKMGVWPDAYYTTFNMFNAAGTAFLGAKVCAYDRAKMLTGAAATQQCFDTSTSYGGLLPADLDGARLPPAGAPNTVVALGATTGTLATWKFHVDWTTPANTTFTGPTTLTTTAYAEACGTSGTCIPQSGGGSLDSLSDRVMFRLAYRNFADGHQSLVVNHSITAGTSVGVRWYELRLDASSNASIFQQGTYAPDANYRWMGSIAQDQAGNMALGYSVSSSSLKPSIRYTGRLAGDAAGQMTQGEGTLITGGGAQGSSLTRWGDYSMMSVDPVDDCTFWFTSEYIPANGTFNWKTRIGSFKMPGCGATASNDFSISASPATVSVAAGGTGTSTISTAITAGAAQSVALSASGLPAGATASFSPASVTSGGSSTLTLSAGTAAAGTYSLTITGTGASATRTTAVSFVVAAAPDFSIAVTPSTGTVNTGSSITYSVSTGSIGGSAQSIALSVSGLPAGVTGSFAPASVTAGSGSTLTLTAATGATLGSAVFTVTGTGTNTHSATATVVVQTPPVADFTIAVSPASATVVQGASATFTVSTTAVNGSTQSVALSVTGLPSGATGAFSPASVTAGGSSTLTITTTATTTTGAAALSITGTSGATTHSAAATLTVNAPSSTPTLTSGVPVTGIGGAVNSQQFWVINVPAGQSTLTVTTSGGTGDADLYVKLGAKPTTSVYDCRSYGSTTAETCTITAPAAGAYYILINGYTAFSGVTLTATYVGDTTTPLTNGVAVTGIAGASGSQQYWKLSVPSGQAKVVFAMSGGTGDADLYVKSGSKPTTTSYTCRPYLTGNNETCTITAPAAGDYYVMIRGYTAYSGVTLKGTYP
jgi:hypothetical protein